MTDAGSEADDEAADPITLTIEIDPTAFDEPRALMYDRLCEEFGQDTVAELLAANLNQNLTAQAMQLINAIWDNRDQIELAEDSAEPDSLPDQPGGPDV
ncbi:hypothetical protein [Halorhabdus salina]|uniref:hypothetical protein n=1 Tax=Halorhabdus salina TaxID=2750670 RepID=UPI0015EFD62A|nr:hypothetical protein [Halorhabdus salina]